MSQNNIKNSLSGNGNSSGKNSSLLADEITWLSALVNSADDAIISKTLDGVITSWNKGAEHLFGYAAEEVVGQSVLILIPEEKQDDEKLILERINSGGQIDHFETFRRRKDGSLVEVSLSVSPIKDPDGKIIGASKIARDMSRIKQAEAKSIESESQLRLITDALPVLISYVDKECCYQFVNRRYIDWFDIKPEEVAGKHLSEVIGKSAYQAVLPRIEQVISGVEVTFEQLMPYPGNDRYIHVNYIPHFDAQTGNVKGFCALVRDISENKKVEEKLRESESRFRLATEAANMFTWERDFETGKIKWSENALSLLGNSLDKMPENGDEAQFFVLPEDRPGLHAAFEKAVADGDSKFTAEFRGYDSANNLRTWLTQGSIFRNNNNEIIRSVGVTQDITRRKKIEEQLRENRGVLSLAMSSSRMGAWSRNLLTEEVYWSPELEAIFGLAEGTFAGTRGGFQEYVFEEDKERIISEVENALNEARSYIIEFRYHHADGSLRWMEGRGQAVYSADGKPVNVYGIGIDITERKRAALNAEFLADISQELVQVSTPDDILRTAGERLNGFLDISMCAFIEIDETTERAGINCEWHKAGSTGLAGDYYLPDFLTDEYRQSARAGQAIIIRDIFDDARIVSPEKFASLGIGAELHIPLLKDGHWKYSFCVYRSGAYNWREDEVELLIELSSRVWARLERAFAEQEREALLKREHSARLQAEDANRLKDEFLATISHELRTPLNAILGWSQMLTSGTFDQTSAARAIQTIYRNAKSQAQLIEDILDVSRIITGKLRIDAKPVLLAPIIQTAVESLRPLIESKNIRLHMSFDFESHKVSADPDRLQQVVWNLLSNAVKFTPEKGEIMLALENAESGTKIVISDTGKGISPEFLPFVFERFRQADGSTTRHHGGLGLGLAIVRHIVELHGGSVEVMSEGDGKGTTFTVDLPFAETPVTLPEESNGQSLPLNASGSIEADSGVFENSLKGLRVILLDDENDSLELLVTLLTQNGVEVRPHSNVRDALDTLKNWKPDVIISDLAMPEEDGYSFIKKLRELSPEDGGTIPAIALTAYVGIKERTKVLSSGFQLYVPKPVEPTELLSTLAGVV